MDKRVLVINAGSSSIKFQVFLAHTPEDLDQIVGGQMEGIGVKPHFVAKSPTGEKLADRFWEEGKGPATHKGAMQVIIDWIGNFLDGAKIDVVGHRVVHGGTEFAAPVLVDGHVHEELTHLVPLAPLHQPHNLKAIAAVGLAYPGVPQVACFDTAFHRDHPKVADSFAIPREFYDKGVRRYGFHGMSYEFIARELKRMDPELARGRVVVAHLGNGASMCGIKDGVSMDSTMGFTALDGLCMGTRSGQIDPGVLLHLIDHEGMSVKEVTNLLYKESGLKGLSGVSSDMRDLEQSDAPEAEEAIAYFVHQIRRNFGALAASIGGVDAFVFTGGIGENSAAIRTRVTDGLGWAGVVIDPAKNAAGPGELTAEGAAVRTFAIKTNEECMIAMHALDALDS